MFAKPAIRAGRLVGRKKRLPPAGTDWLREKNLNNCTPQPNATETVCFSNRRLNIIKLKTHESDKASVEFHEALPSPNALRSVAEDIQINQTGTRVHKDI